MDPWFDNSKPEGRPQAQQQASSEAQKPQRPKKKNDYVPAMIMATIFLFASLGIWIVITHKSAPDKAENKNSEGAAAHQNEAETQDKATSETQASAPGPQATKQTTIPSQPSEQTGVEAAHNLSEAISGEKNISPRLTEVWSPSKESWFEPLTGEEGEWFIVRMSAVRYVAPGEVHFYLSVEPTGGVKNSQLYLTYSPGSSDQGSFYASTTGYAGNSLRCMGGGTYPCPLSPGMPTYIEADANLASGATIAGFTFNISTGGKWTPYSFSKIPILPN